MYFHISFLARHHWLTVNILYPLFIVAPERLGAQTVHHNRNLRGDGKIDFEIYARIRQSLEARPVQLATKNGPHRP